MEFGNLGLQITVAINKGAQNNFEALKGGFTVFSKTVNFEDSISVIYNMYNSMLGVKIMSSTKGRQLLTGNVLIFVVFFLMCDIICHEMSCFYVNYLSMIILVKLRYNSKISLAKVWSFFF